ncbi:hypothetical protein KR51_00009350 [Rubidibacter lacunae KORDI 51-2]|uniref:Thiol-disulfide oxidoreductase DCC n=1 Tax=Rubidibacter lacunae KORDI 51-2 TaxID=582515 RepID=U5DL46_9CHRO|nr:DUF393 domain-containing protein [Rubidibacter lacunae]ERN42411.1 hypothetical protein KR51_00009350 [Rubidibacter lacunae KORDI 51-2]
MKAPTTSDVAATSDAIAPHWQLELLYDGECPFCLREVNFLQQRDSGRGLVNFVDIASDGYAVEAHGGVNYATAMGRIHAVLPAGSTIAGVEVFRRVYEILGLGWVYAPTRWPVVGAFVDRVYEFWADRRLKWTGRPDLETLVARRTCGDRCQLSD